MHDQMQDACNRLGGQYGSLTTVESRQRQPVSSKVEPETSSTTREGSQLETDVLTTNETLSEDDVEFVKVGREGSREKRRLSITG